MAAARNEAKRSSVTPERWQQVKALLAAALEVEASGQSAYLDDACLGDSSLREEIEALLAIERESDPALLESGITLDSEKLSASGPRIGRRIGAYQIVEEIGIGGMGEVYRAVRADDQYRQQVAIKLVGAGQDSNFVIGRFKNERQVLASLDHPNIARLLDGGTTDDGVPYFVMELIEGRPIHEYCDARKLPTTERLKLFLQVCSAVQYAHQRLIIHRDLKPSNILVTAEGTPKLLDFGIAKMLDASAVSEMPEATISMFRLLTPGYASPEQVRGETITTASDVYSLGVLLYELLSGHRPYRISMHSTHEIERAVCEFEPERPSAAAARAESSGASSQLNAVSVSALRDGTPEKLSRSLRGDLDNIVMVALRKEPQRRYASVEQFATDIRRHLENLPVTASKDTFRYRTTKFVRRHKTAVAAAVMVGITVVCGFAATLYEARVAHTQQLRAEQRFNDVRELANSLMFDVHDSIQDLPGSTSARKLLVERALRYLDSLSRDAASDLSLQRELATAYEKVGTVQGNPFGSNLGDTQGALASYQKSLCIREVIAKAQPDNISDQLSLAHCRHLIAQLKANSVGPDALDEALQALSTTERILQAAPDNEAVMNEVRGDHGLVALILQASVGDYQESLAHWRKKLAIEDQLLHAGSHNPNMPGIRWLTNIYVGIELARLGSRKEAIAIFRAARLPGDAEVKSMGVEARRVNSWMRGQFADILLADGDLNGALENYRTELRIVEPLNQADPVNSLLDYDLATAYANLGNALSLAGNQAGHQANAMAMLQRAITMFEKQIAHDPAYVEPRWALGRARIWRAEALTRNRNWKGAWRDYQSQLADWQTMAQHYAVAQVFVAAIHAKMGALLVAQDKPGEAEEEYQRSLQIAEPIATAHSSMIDAQYVLADAYSGLGRSAGMLGNNRSLSQSVRSQHWIEARGWYQRSLETWRQISSPGMTMPIGLQCGNPTSVIRQLAECNSRLRPGVGEP